jgi:hypothetical protein
MLPIRGPTAARRACIDHGAMFISRTFWIATALCIALWLLVFQIL